jgi:lipid II:glycine glycyltransferase (peptidoglycan interpeptide bridge formation enzyme)
MLTTPSITAIDPSLPAAGGCASIAALNLAEWQAYVESHPDSTAFHHRNWIEAIRQQYGLQAYIPCLKQGGEIQAAIPFLSGRSLLGAAKLTSLPFTDCLRILSRRPEAAEALAAELVRRHPPCKSMTVRTDTVLARTASISHSVRHEVRLEPSFAALSKRFKPSAHRNLHKARRVGLQFAKRVDAAAMEAFYWLHLLTRRKLGVPVQPKGFFQRLQQNIVQAGLGYIGLVTKEGQPLAAGLFLAFNRTITYKYAASHPNALADRPNDWLVFNALRLAGEEGYGCFDFGISGRRQAGLQRFKRNWGADEIDVHTVQIVGRAKTPIEESALFKVAGGVIRHSPPVICRCTGEILYRFAV